MISITAAETISLVSFTLPATSLSTRAARLYIKATLSCHDLGHQADDIETVTCELVSNAIKHARATAVDVALLLLQDGFGSLAVVVSDPCARPPLRLAPTATAEGGRGLVLVEALATRWGWVPRTPGKAVFALFSREG